MVFGKTHSKFENVVNRAFLVLIFFFLGGGNGWCYFLCLLQLCITHMPDVENFRFFHICHGKASEISPHVEKILISLQSSYTESWKFSTWQFFLHIYNLWYLWQIWGLNPSKSGKGFKQKAIPSFLREVGFYQVVCLIFGHMKMGTFYIIQHYLSFCDNLKTSLIQNIHIYSLSTLSTETFLNFLLLLFAFAFDFDFDFASFFAFAFSFDFDF